MISDLTPDSSQPGELTLIDQLLKEQNELYTAVNEIADRIDSGELRTDTYKHLIPLDKPQKGQQYAFQVELDKCTSCKACVAACHSLNGLEDNEAWRDVGLVLGGDDAPAYQQTVTTACHHCHEPQCMHGCPVKAYEKDEETGIVRHLDDQCIGCEYCSLKCPYDVPKYSSRLGIVRKCDMCYQRLAVGEAPACVQACPNEAIKIINVDVEEQRAAREEKKGFINGAPLPHITLPTTEYIGRAVPKTAKPADQEKLIPAADHIPLVLMLTLTQAGVGALIASTLLGDLVSALIGVALFFIGLSCSILHLGRPLGAWRFFLGLKTSWLSREILAFSLFAPLALLSLSLPILENIAPLENIKSFLDQWSILHYAGLVSSLSVPIIGLIAVFTSVMIYHDTQRVNWHWKWSGAAFFGTTFAFFGATMGMGWAGLCLIPVITDLLKLLPALTDKKEHSWTPKLHQARLMWHPLRKFTIARLVLGILATLLSPLNLFVGLTLLLGGELLSRYLYFRAVHSPKMPGQF